MPLSLHRNRWEGKAVKVDEMRTWQVILDRILSDEELPQLIVHQADKRVLLAVTFAAMILSAHQQFQRTQLVHKSLRCIEYLTGENMSREIELADLAIASNIEASALVERLGEIIFDKSSNLSRELASFSSIDRCPICNQVLLWDSLTGAYCPSGHLFARCALTFLPITEPGISKYCERCHREFLDQDHFFQTHQELLDPPSKRHSLDITHVSQQQSALGPCLDNEYSARQPSSDHEKASKSVYGLAKLLFIYFSVCPFCQGFFYN
ncbi:MAG: hypothetical protein Q9167_001493 [Letrouitia subvulpina]